MPTDFAEPFSQFIVDAPCRLDAFLAAQFPSVSRARIARDIALGLAQIDGEACLKPGQKLKSGQTVAMAPPEDAPAHDLSPAQIPLRVIFEDATCLVVDKPRGLATHPAASLKEPSLVNALLGRGGDLSQAGGAFRPGIVHRLDKETTGLIVIAKTDAAHVALARQFEKKIAERRYLGIVQGEPSRERFNIDAPIGRDPRDRRRMTIDDKGKPALTYCRTLQRLNAGTLMAFRLGTGRTHQIRVHLKAIGHPILGDRVYAPTEQWTMPLQLHAALLSFELFPSGERRTFFALPPEDFLVRDGIGQEALDWPTE